MTSHDQIRRIECELQSPARSARREQLIAASWHGFGALSLGLVTAALTGSFAWGAAAAAGDLLLRPQLQLLHKRLVEQLFPAPDGLHRQDWR